MKKPFFSLLCAGLLAALGGCNDQLSEVGDSLKSGADFVSARLDSIPFIAKTIPSGKVFSRSTYTLLGDLQDVEYGHLKADFVTQLQSARGFRFSYSPRDGKIDSVKMVVSYSSWAGDSLAWLKAAVYEIKQPLPKDYYSADFGGLIDDRRFLGAKAYCAANKKGIHQLEISLPVEVGQRFYDMSLSNSSVFDTDEGLYRHVLGGLYVTTTTGSGSILSIYNNHVDIYYSYQKTFKDSQGRDSIGWETGVETFANTKKQILINRFSYEGMERLISEGQGEFTYVKAPAGVMTEITISKEAMRRSLFDAKTKRQINRATFGLDVERPSNQTLLAPPTYLLLLPKDSIPTFFPQNQTERTQPRTAYLSSAYSITNRTYQFGNIARLLSEHIDRHGRLVDGQMSIDKDLSFVLLPIRRQSVGKTIQETTALDNFIFPSAAKLLVGREAKLGVLTTSYQSVK